MSGNYTAAQVAFNNDPTNKTAAQLMQALMDAENDLTDDEIFNGLAEIRDYLNGGEPA